MGRESYETVSQRMPPAKLFALGELQRERSRSSPDPAPAQPQAESSAELTAAGPPAQSRVNRGAVLLTLDRARARSAAAELHHSQRHLDIACKEFLSSEGKLLPFTSSTVTTLTPTSGEKAVWNHNPYSGSTTPPDAEEPTPVSPVAVAQAAPATITTDEEESREESMAAFLARRLNPDAMPWAPTDSPTPETPAPVANTPAAPLEFEPPPWWSCMPVIQREPARITNLRKRLQRMEQTKRRVAEGIPVDRRQLAALEFEGEVRDELQRWQSTNRAHHAPTEGHPIPAPSPVVTPSSQAERPVAPAAPQQRPPQVAQLWATAITLTNSPATTPTGEAPAVHNPVSPLIGVLRTNQPESPWDKEIAASWTAPRKRVAISDEVQERAAEEIPDTPPLTPVLPPAAPPADDTPQIYTKRKPKRQIKQANEIPTETVGVPQNTTPAATGQTDVVMALSMLNQQKIGGTTGSFHWRETPVVARPTPPSKKKAAPWS